MDNLDPNKTAPDENPIRRPDAPSHFMQIDDNNDPVAVHVDGHLVARSELRRVVREVGRSAFDPVFYYSRGDLVNAELVPSDKTTFCPLKGTARYFDLRVDEKTYANAVWSYEDILQFDERIERIRGRIGFDPSIAQVHAA